jgi:hypothetical protein
MAGSAVLAGLADWSYHGSRRRGRHRRPFTVRRGHPEANPVSVVGGSELVRRPVAPLIGLHPFPFALQRSQA